MKQLVIMAKKPVAGAVKSRLAKTIGAARAAGVYRSLMHTTIRNLAFDPRWETTLAISPQTSFHDSVWPCFVNKVLQVDGDLGVRMQALFDHIAKGPIIIIGTDIPSISASDIDQGFKILNHKDIVFGDAGDGGYWLVGARRSNKVLQIFGDVRWSGPNALADTIANVKALAGKALSIGYVGEKYDIDDEGDYRKWRKSQC